MTTTTTTTRQQARPGPRSCSIGSNTLAGQKSHRSHSRCGRAAVQRILLVGTKIVRLQVKLLELGPFCHCVCAERKCLVSLAVAAYPFAVCCAWQPGQLQLLGSASRLPGQPRKQQTPSRRQRRRLWVEPQIQPFLISTTGSRFRLMQQGPRQRSELGFLLLHPVLPLCHRAPFWPAFRRCPRAWAACGVGSLNCEYGLWCGKLGCAGCQARAPAGSVAAAVQSPRSTSLFWWQAHHPLQRAPH